MTKHEPVDKSIAQFSHERVEKKAEVAIVFLKSPNMELSSKVPIANWALTALNFRFLYVMSYIQDYAH